MQTAVIDMRAVDSPTCLLCHTVATTITHETLAAGARWVCETCGQVWSSRRLGAVAAYARFVAPARVGASL